MNIGIVHQLGVDRYSLRKPDRVRVILNTRLRISDRPDAEISVRNISNRGFMAEGQDPIEVGSNTMIYLPGVGWSLATVRWSAGSRFGAKFADSINMRQFWRANPPPRLSMLDDLLQSA